MLWTDYRAWSFANVLQQRNADKTKRRDVGF
jgi:hypothetical protein